MKRLKLTILIIIFLSGFSFAQNGDDIIGKYRLPNKLDIEIYKSNNKYLGKIIALNTYKNGQKKDIKNPDLSKRDNPLIGMVIIRNLNYDKEENEWINGNIYGPDKGINLELKVTEIRKNEIEVVASKLFFWKTLVRTKLTSNSA